MRRRRALPRARSFCLLASFCLDSAAARSAIPLSFSLSRYSRHSCANPPPVQPLSCTSIRHPSVHTWRAKQPILPSCLLMPPTRPRARALSRPSRAYCAPAPQFKAGPRTRQFKTQSCASARRVNTSAVLHVCECARRVRMTGSRCKRKCAKGRGKSKSSRQQQRVATRAVVTARSAKKEGISVLGVVD